MCVCVCVCVCKEIHTYIYIYIYISYFLIKKISNLFKFYTMFILYTHKV